MEQETLKDSYIVIDFDSTFMKVEALEELAEIVLKNSPEKEAILEEIKAITSLGVDGKITFNESLKRRLGLLRFNQEHLEKLIRRLKRKVSTSFSRNKAFFKKFKGRIYIISNGFKDFIDPIVAPYEIDSTHVLGNTFIFDEEGWCIGFDEENPLAHSKGKSRILKAQQLEGEIMVIGDAYTDFEMVEAGSAHKFFAFTENVLRENILDRADHVTPSFDEFLYVNQMPRALSYPKNRIKVLLINGVHPEAQEAFEKEGYQVSTMPKSKDTKLLSRELEDISILGIDPRTPITKEILKNANRLIAIAVFGTEVSQIDQEACAERGIIVFNAPYTNTRSLVELAIGEIIMLMRRVPVYKQAMDLQKLGLEIRGKKLGIIGYGHAGQQLSVLAEALGMNVYFYDLIDKPALGNATKCESLREVIKKSDVISIHVDNRPENKGFFGKSAFKHLKEGAILINLSSGSAIKLKELVAHLKSNQLRGAALDLSPQSASSTKRQGLIEELEQMDNVILTPNIAGHTVEAQQGTANFVPTKVIDYINTGNTAWSINFPSLQLPTLKNAHRLIHIHENRPGLIARINGVLAQHNINILGQYLQTNEQIGYVITDINKKYGQQVLKDLKEIEHTIKFRVLY